MCTKKVIPNANEPNRLSCNSGDLIEIIDVSNDNTIKVRLILFFLNFFLFLRVV